MLLISNTQKGRTILLRSLQKAFWVEFVCFKEWIKFRFHRQCQIIWCNRQTSKGNLVKFWPRKDVYEQDQEAIAEFIKRWIKVLKTEIDDKIEVEIMNLAENSWRNQSWITGVKYDGDHKHHNLTDSAPTPDTYLNLLVV